MFISNYFNGNTMLIIYIRGVRQCCALYGISVQELQQSTVLIWSRQEWRLPNWRDYVSCSFICFFKVRYQEGFLDYAKISSVSMKYREEDIVHGL